MADFSFPLINTGTVQMRTAHAQQTKLMNGVQNCMIEKDRVCIIPLSQKINGRRVKYHSSQASFVVHVSKLR